MIEDNGQEVRPEIYNNIGSLNIRRGDLEGAKKYLNMALEKVRSDIENQQGKWYLEIPYWKFDKISNGSYDDFR